METGQDYPPEHWRLSPMPRRKLTLLRGETRNLFLYSKLLFLEIDDMQVVAAWVALLVLNHFREIVVFFAEFF